MSFTLQQTVLWHEKSRFVEIIIFLAEDGNASTKIDNGSSEFRYMTTSNVIHAIDFDSTHINQDGSVMLTFMRPYSGLKAFDPEELKVYTAIHTTTGADVALETQCEIEVEHESQTGDNRWEPEHGEVYK